MKLLEILEKILLRNVNNLGLFRGGDFGAKIMLRFSIFLGVTYKPAGQHEQLSPPANQPDILCVKIIPKNLKKTYHNLSLHKNHHPEKRPKLSTILSSAILMP